MTGGMWPNCLGAVRKAGIRCSHQLTSGNPDTAGGAAGGGVLSTFSVLIPLYKVGCNCYGYLHDYSKDTMHFFHTFGDLFVQNAEIVVLSFPSFIPSFFLQNVSPTSLHCGQVMLTSPQT